MEKTRLGFDAAGGRGREAAGLEAAGLEAGAWEHDEKPALKITPMSSIRQAMEPPITRRIIRD